LRIYCEFLVVPFKEEKLLMMFGDLGYP
jgi:hypothetical protein